MVAASILIVNFNAGRHLARCIEALRRQDSSNFEVLLLDNASNDDSWALAQQAASGDPRFHFEEAGVNLGFAAGNNRLAAKARAPWLAFLNPDAIAAPDWLGKLLDAVVRHPGVALFGSQQLDDGDPAILDGAGDRYLCLGLPWRGGHGWPASLKMAEGEVFTACAAASLCRRDAFEAAGGFDESFFCYVEDVDLGFRLRLQGETCIQVPAAVVRHVGSISSGGAGSAFARYHGTRNLIWCFVKNMPWPIFWPLMPLHLIVLLLLWLRALSRGMGGTVARGIGDGLAGLGRVWLARRKIQARRRASLWAIARALTWDLREYLTRAPANRL
ncbi:glycosyltransferase family 2 protein [Ferrovibrio sp. MS7]|uniref:glycosyltransferase family 2 protein n=1 Tax=Ferrovibrio plantarum TaxID=3119164 RepID=UPI0031353EBD